MGHQINYTPAGHLSLLMAGLSLGVSGCLTFTLFSVDDSCLTAVGPWLITFFWLGIHCPHPFSHQPHPLPPNTISMDSTLLQVLLSLSVFLNLSSSDMFLYPETILSFLLTSLVIVYLWYRNKYTFLGTGLRLVCRNLLLHSYLNNRKFC